jgi:NDP-sugar pyrophosphorylase family protein
MAAFVNPVNNMNESHSGTKGMKAMLLAAGLGTRLKPWTDSHPKALAQVNNKSLLQRNIEYLQRSGIFDVIVNVHHFAGQIIQLVEQNKGWGSNIIISDETDMVLETGGGLKKAASYLEGGSFVLMNVDILTDLHLPEMVRYHQREKPLATLAVRNRETSRYFMFDEQDTLCGWQNIKTGEKKISRPAQAPELKAFSGIHVIDPAIFSYMPGSGKYSMVDVYLEVSKTLPVKGYDHTSSKFIDVGKPESLVAAGKLFE